MFRCILCRNPQFISPNFSFFLMFDFSSLRYIFLFNLPCQLIYYMKQKYTMREHYHPEYRCCTSIWTVFTADSRYASQVAISTPGYTDPV